MHVLGPLDQFRFSPPALEVEGELLDVWVAQVLVLFPKGISVWFGKAKEIDSILEDLWNVVCTRFSRFGPFIVLLAGWCLLWCLGVLFSFLVSWFVGRLLVLAFGCLG